MDCLKKANAELDKNAIRLAVQNAGLRKDSASLKTQNTRLTDQKTKLVNQNKDLTEQMAKVKMELALAQDSIRKRDVLDSHLPRSDSTKATEEISWCFRCHCTGHWMGTCCNHSTKTYFDCYSFQLHDIVCDNDTFESISNQTIPTIEELVFHIFHATRRLNQYAAFTRDRDDLLVDVIKKSASDEHIGVEASLLARLRDVRPYEAFAAKTSRLAHDLVESCMSAIRELYVACVLPSVKVEVISQPDSEDARWFEKKCYSAMLGVKKNCIDARAHLKKGTPYIPMKRLSIGKDLKNYQRNIEMSYQRYTVGLEELAIEWRMLDQRYKLWKIKPTTRQGQVFADLLFTNLVIGVETSAEKSTPTVCFPTVESLQHYYKPKNVVDEIAASSIEDGRSKRK